MKIQYSDLSYRGDRNYIKGLDLLNFFLQSNEINTNDFDINRFSINKVIMNNGYWSESICKPNNYSASMTCTISNLKKTFYFIESNSPVEKVIPNNSNTINNYNKLSRLSGEFFLEKELNSIDLYLMIEEANKTLHSTEKQQLVNGKPNVKLIYYEKIQGLFKYYKKFNLKNIGIKKIGNLCYTVSEINFKKSESSPIICFSYNINKST